MFSFRRLFWISILYRTKDATKWVGNPLELIWPKKVDLLLIMLMLTSVSMLDGKWVISLGCIAVKVVENNIFTNSIIGTTMQDSSKKERSN